MDESQRLASEMRLKETPSSREDEFPSNGDDALTNTDEVPTNADLPSNATAQEHAPVHASDSLTVTAPIAKVTMRSAETAAALEQKKIADAEFLRRYNRRQITVRIKLGLAAISIFMLVGFAYRYVLNSAHGTTEATYAALGAGVPALVGSRDMSCCAAIASVSRKENHDVKVSALKHQIDDLEASGQFAVMPRMVLERLLVSAGRRAEGYAVGDVLVKRYPRLPATYYTRANSEYQLQNFKESMDAYDKFYALLQTSDAETRRAWLNTGHNAFFAAVVTSDFDRARRYEQLELELGARARSFDRANWRASGIVNDMLDQDELERLGLITHDEKLVIEKQPSLPEVVDGVPRDDFKFENAFRAHDYPSCRRIVEQSLRGDALKDSDNEPISYEIDNWQLRAARLALAENDPKRCLALLDKVIYPSTYRSLLEAKANNLLRRPEAALESINVEVDNYDRLEATDNTIYLPMLAEQARALSLQNKDDAALKLCNSILEKNPAEISAMAVKLGVLKKQCKTEQAEEQMMELQKQKTRLISQLKNPF